MREMKAVKPNAPPARHHEGLPPTEVAPAFEVRALPIHGDLILSPMDGYSDWPFRSLCRGLGSAISYTEFINNNHLTVFNNVLDILFKQPVCLNKLLGGMHNF